MNRTVKAAVFLIAASGILCQPGIAAADSVGAAVVIGDDNQVAGDDIFDAGHDNIVGSGNNGGPAGVGSGAASSASSTSAAYAVIIGDGNQVAGDDIFDAYEDNIVGSGNGTEGDSAG